MACRRNVWNRTYTEVGYYYSHSILKVKYREGLLYVVIRIAHQQVYEAHIDKFYHQVQN